MKTTTGLGKRVKRKVLSSILIGTTVMSLMVQSVYAGNGYSVQPEIESPSTDTAEEDQPTSLSSMSDKQLSSISMLNHMTVLSQEINASANSKLFLDNAYSDIVNNINPNAVDEDSMDQIRILLNTIYQFHCPIFAHQCNLQVRQEVLVDKDK